MKTEERSFSDGAACANQCLLFTVDPADCVGKKVLAVPRCCQKRKGSQDPLRINSEVAGGDCDLKGLTASIRKIEFF